MRCWLVGVVLALSCGGEQDEMPVLDETSGGKGSDGTCIFTPRAVGSDESTPVGTADARLAGLAGTHDAMFHWHTVDDVGWMLEGTDTTVHIVIAEAAIAARWVDAVASDGCDHCICEGWLELDVDVGFTTDDGAFDVSGVRTLSVHDAITGLEVPVDATNAGTFSVATLPSAPEGELSAVLRGELGPGELVSGSLWLEILDQLPNGTDTFGGVMLAQWTTES